MKVLKPKHKTYTVLLFTKSSTYIMNYTTNDEKTLKERIKSDYDVFPVTHHRIEKVIYNY